MRDTKRTLCQWIPILCALALLLVACQPAKRVVLHVDGQDQILDTSATTVRELVAEQQLILGEWDRIEPGLWAELGRNTTVTIIRSREESSREILPFTREVIRDEAIPEGKTQLLQAGRTGVMELVYRISFDGESELDRQIISRRVITDARSEIVAVGISGGRAATPITGTIAYLANGNAWIMRGNTAEKRPLTYSGDLDGRVFDMSADGQDLLFTRHLAQPETDSSQLTPPFNELWMLDTRILQEEPAALGITNVIYAEWSSKGSSIAYSTADSTQGAPGWRARNDLWIRSVDGMTETLLLPASGGGVYGWWGTRFAWGPDGRWFAYATPGAIGLIDGASGNQTPLLQFPELRTYSEWVWVPPLSWSPEGRFLATVAHDLSPGAAVAEDSAAFDLWILDTVGGISVPLIERVGMWSGPKWSGEWMDAYGQVHVDIAFGVSQVEALSQYGHYDLFVMDRDGSNRTKLLPSEGEIGLQVLEFAWAPGERKFACIWQGELYLVGIDGGELVPLTRGVQCDRVDWAGQPLAAQVAGE